MTSPRWRIEIQKIFLDIRNLKKEIGNFGDVFEKFSGYSKSRGIFHKNTHTLAGIFRFTLILHFSRGKGAQGVVFILTSSNPPEFLL